ncbi:MAG: oxygen-dependent coproporphyrinogen oxidase [Bernardetiaceae bacterium]|nr:oxygen-dependent coproporphyrinogen oxidase [Bernardetiaceae bacterium]
MNNFQSEAAEWFKTLQDSICKAIEGADGKAKFEEELWERPGGGGGRTRVIRHGDVIAKGGVNFSAVHGEPPQKMLEVLKLDKANFFASGVSIVLHPQSPMVPIIHMNVRYFEMSNGVYWFGGGIDLTPHYVVDADARYFHEQLKAVCDKHHADYYPKFKTWADDYFYLPHRQETRGIGGIFFDHLKENETQSKTDIWNFVKDVGSIFADTYTHLMQKNKNLPYNDAHTAWQNVRRSRYVEFNLIYDKGTKFGLDTDGRTESILMSMPPVAEWHYNYAPERGTPEAETIAKLKKEVDWISI